MPPIQIVAQAIGILGMIIIVLSYQQKKQSLLIALQLIGSALFAVNYFMIGALTGALLNIVSVLRSLVFLNKKRLHAEHPAWLFGFIAVYLAFYALTFTAFQKPFTPHAAAVEFLPVVGMTVTTIAYRHNQASLTRKLGFINSPCWLLYNVAAFSIGGIIGESVSLISIIVGLFRLDYKKTSDENQP